MQSGRESLSWKKILGKTWREIEKIRRRGARKEERRGKKKRIRMKHARWAVGRGGGGEREKKWNEKKEARRKREMMREKEDVDDMGMPKEGKWSKIFPLQTPPHAFLRYQGSVPFILFLPLPLLPSSHSPFIAESSYVFFFISSNPSRESSFSSSLFRPSQLFLSTKIKTTHMYIHAMMWPLHLSTLLKPTKYKLFILHSKLLGPLTHPLSESKKRYFLFFKIIDTLHLSHFIPTLSSFFPSPSLPINTQYSSFSFPC